MTQAQSAQKARQDQFIQELIAKYGQKEAMNILARASGYEEAPPTITEFLDDAEFMKPVIGNSLFPTWREALQEIYPNPYYSPYVEIVISGAIGVGKTTFSLVGTLYDLCKILHLRNPQEHFKLLDSTVIAYALMNATLGLSKDVLFEQLMDWLNTSPYFKDLMKSNQRGKVKAKTLFPKNVDIVSGSRSSHVLGRAIVGAILSELNFQTKVKGQAKDNFTNIMRRMQSRFMASGGSLPSHVWLDSSKTDDDSFIEEHLKASEQAGLKGIRVYDYPVWVVKAHSGIYSGDTFEVFRGDSSQDPFIVEAPEQVAGIDSDNLITVPVEYRTQFETDIYNSLRDIAGVSTVSSRRFIKSIAKIDQALNRDNAVTKELVTLDFFDQKQQLLPYIKTDLLLSDQRQRYIHIDLGLSQDKTGIAATRLDGFVTVKSFNPTTGREEVSREPRFVVEWVLSLKAPVGQEVAIYKIKQLMIDLRVEGYPIGVISTDGYQSSNLRQDLMLAGFETQLVSVDRTKDAYLALKQAILTDRVSLPKHPLLRKELEFLNENDKKIDHPDIGSKDLTDAVAGSMSVAKAHMDDFAASTATSDFLNALESVGSSGSVYDMIASAQGDSFEW